MAACALVKTKQDFESIRLDRIQEGKFLGGIRYPQFDPYRGIPGYPIFSGGLKGAVYPGFLDGKSSADGLGQFDRWTGIDRASHSGIE